MRLKSMWLVILTFISSTTLVDAAGENSEGNQGREKVFSGGNNSPMSTQEVNMYVQNYAHFACSLLRKFIKNTILHFSFPKYTLLRKMDQMKTANEARKGQLNKFRQYISLEL